MFIVCDVSGLSGDGDRYWVLGSVWIPKEQLSQYERAIVNFRLQNKLWGELKWEKITPQKLKEYKEFLTISLRKFPTEIKILLRDKKIEPPEGRFENEGELISTFFYTLIGNHMPRVLQRIPTTRSFHILLDKEGWAREQSLNLKDFLEFPLVLRGFKQSIDHLSQCDSKISSLLQFCDIITGAVSAVWNQRQTDISDDKGKIIKHIENILNHPLNTETLPGATKFNLWPWRPSKN